MAFPHLSAYVRKWIVPPEIDQVCPSFVPLKVRQLYDALSQVPGIWQITEDAREIISLRRELDRLTMMEDVDRDITSNISRRWDLLAQRVENGMREFMRGPYQQALVVSPIVKMAHPGQLLPEHIPEEEEITKEWFSTEQSVQLAIALAEDLYASAK